MQGVSLSLGATMNVLAKKHWQKFCMVPQMHRKKHERLELRIAYVQVLIHALLSLSSLSKAKYTD
jgi:hypothetical protein